MKFIETLNFGSIVELLALAKNSVYISLPGVDEEIAKALITFNKKIDINVLFDNSESSIRSGYGEIKAIEMLREGGIKLKECSGNFISFIISDDTGYFIFPQSRIFSAEPSGPNAVRIDPVTIQLLLLQYFGTPERIDKYSEGHTNALGKTYTYFERAFEEMNEEGAQVKSISFDDGKYDEIKKQINQNPPVEPDIRRILDVYTTRFQYVELIAKNIKIGQHRANMPEDSIPVQNKELRKRLISSIKAFENIERSIELLELGELESKVKDIRKEFLIPITCRNGKNLIKKERLVAFRAQVEVLNEEFKTISKKLKGVLTAEIERTKEQIRNEWRLIFKQFPPEELKDVTEKDNDYQKKIELILNRMIREIKFPPLDKIVTEFSLNAYYFELTWDDLKDDVLIAELIKKVVIEETDQTKLADFKKALGQKK
jgi:hypothetical protein